MRELAHRTTQGMQLPVPAAFQPPLRHADRALLIFRGGRGTRRAVRQLQLELPLPELSHALRMPWPFCWAARAPRTVL